MSNTPPTPPSELPEEPLWDHGHDGDENYLAWVNYACDLRSLLAQREERIRELEGQLESASVNYAKETHDRIEAEQRAEAAERRLAEREGMVMVPREPTKKAIRAIVEARLYTSNTDSGAVELYEMLILNAAPAVGEKEKP